MITIVSSVVVPILLALLGHRLGEARTRKEEEKVRAKSVYLPPPQPKTALNWLAEVGNVAAPTNQLIAPSSNRRKWMPVAVTVSLIGVGVITGVMVSRLMRLDDRPVAVAVPAEAAVTPAAGLTFRMFIDRGQHFVRAGTEDGLVMGAAVAVINPKGAVTGEGIVIEIWENIARLNVEPAQPAGAVLQASFTPRRAAAAAAPSPALKAPRAAVAPAAATPAIPAAPAGLKGDASISSFGPGKRLRLANHNTFAWNRCELRLPNNTRYPMERMAAGESDGIMLSRFTADGVERQAEPTWLKVACAEGSVRLNVRAQ